MAAPEERSEIEPEPASITRYPNRRLYDRSQGRYVTLPEIADMVRGGKTVCVRDNKTGEDITRSILMQIIMEHHPERMAMFPVAILNSLIQANETALAVVGESFRQSLVYMDLLRRSAAVNPLALSLDWLKAFLPSLSPGSPASPPPVGEADAAVLARRVAELERRLEELQAGLEKSRPPAASGPETSSPNGRRAGGS